jgi:hypothetical protein
MAKKLGELKKMLDNHYRNEARIMNEICESKLSTEENKELEEFATNHPYTKVADLIQNTVTK